MEERGKELINWNEKEETQIMYENMNFEYNTYNLQLIAKYIREVEFPDLKGNALKESLTNKLDDYLSECRKKGVFWYDLFFVQWSQPFLDAIEIAISERIQDKFPLNITANEWTKIKELENEEMERLVFVMLVVSKYCEIVKQRKNKEDQSHPYKVKLEDSKIRKLAKVKVHRGNAASKNCYRELLKEKKYIELSKRNQIYVLFADEVGSPIETITDYDNLDLYYERLNGSRIDECKKCGKLFKQNRQNNLQLCKACRTYQSKVAVESKCVDCGNGFIKKPTDKRKCRCDSCQKIHAKELTKLRNRRYYERKA